MFADLKDCEFAACVCQLFALARKITLDCQKHAGNGFSVFADIFELVLIDVCSAEEVVERGSAVELEHIVAQAFEVCFRVVVFIVDVAHNFLEYILQRHNALSAAIFIYHDGEVLFAFAKILQQIVDHTRFGHEIRLAKQLAPIERIVDLADIW